MSSAPKKFKFEDLQPHVEMLIDALENKGASSSGVPYNKEVYAYPPLYRKLLEDVRNKTITYAQLEWGLAGYSRLVLHAAGNNQVYRICKILEALDFFFKKEYNIYND